MDTDTRLTCREAVDVTCGIAAGLAFLHRCNLAHNT
jgi:hypothetical protein